MNCNHAQSLLTEFADDTLDAGDRLAGADPSVGLRRLRDAAPRNDDRQASAAHAPSRRAVRRVRRCPGPAPGPDPPAGRRSRAFIPHETDLAAAASGPRALAGTGRGDLRGLASRTHARAAGPVGRSCPPTRRLSPTASPSTTGTPPPSRWQTCPPKLWPVTWTAHKRTRPPTRTRRPTRACCDESTPVDNIPALRLCFAGGSAGPGWAAPGSFRAEAAPCRPVRRPGGVPPAAADAACGKHAAAGWGSGHDCRAGRPGCLVRAAGAAGRRPRSAAGLRSPGPAGGGRDH